MRTITAIVITAVLLLTSWGQQEATLTDTSVATVQDQVQTVPEIDSPQQETAVSTPITRQEAISVALAHAGVQEEAVYDLEAELDREQGTLMWEVDFDYAGTEYEYDIDAYTGAILRSHTQPLKQTAPEKQTTPQVLTREEAKAIAMKHAGITTASDLDIELDKEKGVLIYEVDFEADGIEYEYEINATTGKILRSEKERDD